MTNHHYYNYYSQTHNVLWYFIFVMMFCCSESTFMGVHQQPYQKNHVPQQSSMRSSISNAVFSHNRLFHKTSVSGTSLLLSSYNPNDNETEEERKKRMEKVRQIQANFYKSSDTTENEDNAVSSEPTLTNNNRQEEWLRRDVNDCSILHNVPLWRVQWTELPGFQNVLNVHVAHYTHMFRKLIYERPKPWLYGHVVLPDGSENLNNPNYFLNPNKNENNVTYTGTLMQITDFVEQEDGRLTLVVQALERMKILEEAAQHVPYAVASKIQIDPDLESSETYWLRLIGNTPTDFALSMAYMNSAQSMAAKEAELLRDYEFRHTSMVKQENEVVFLSPLSHVNSSAFVNYDSMNGQLLDSFQKRLRQEAENKGLDDILLLTSPSSGLTTELLEILESPRNDWVFKDLVKKERQVWIELDAMFKCLQKLQPLMDLSKVLPLELLCLLPNDVKDWPKDFLFTKYATEAEEKSQSVGSNDSIVSFLRLDDSWPVLRRASRLSYLVWFLIETTVGGGGMGGEHRQVVLLTKKIEERLEIAISQLKIVTKLIQKEIK